MTCNIQSGCVISNLSSYSTLKLIIIIRGIVLVALFNRHEQILEPVRARDLKNVLE